MATGGILQSATHLQAARYESETRLGILNVVRNSIQEGDPQSLLDIICSSCKQFLQADRVVLLWKDSLNSKEVFSFVDKDIVKFPLLRSTVEGELFSRKSPFINVGDVSLESRFSPVLDLQTGKWIDILFYHLNTISPRPLQYHTPLSHSYIPNCTLLPLSHSYIPTLLKHPRLYNQVLIRHGHHLRQASICLDSSLQQTR